MKDPAIGKIRLLLETPEPPGLGPGPRRDVRPEGQLMDSLDELLAGSKIPGAARECVRALVLLWHDHLDAAHNIAQSIANRDGSLIHGIMHRREPDYSNARYWFHRAGAHPCFAEMSRRVAAMLGSSTDDALRAKLLPGGQWDPCAFVDACERAASSAQERLLREIQRIESEVVLEYLMGEQRAAQSSTVM